MFDLKKKFEKLKDNDPKDKDGEKSDKKPLNKAEIYQAVRRAKLRSNYLNRDLNMNKQVSNEQRNKF